MISLNNLSWKVHHLQPSNLGHGTRAPPRVIRIGTLRPFAARISAAARLPSPPAERHTLPLQTLGPVINTLITARISAALLTFGSARHHVAPIAQASHAFVTRPIRTTQLPQISALLIGRTFLLLAMQPLSARVPDLFFAALLPDLTARLGDIAVALLRAFEALLAPGVGAALLSIPTALQVEADLGRAEVHAHEPAFAIGPGTANLVLEAARNLGLALATLALQVVATARLVCAARLIVQTAVSGDTALALTL